MQRHKDRSQEGAKNFHLCLNILNILESVGPFISNASSVTREVHGSVVKVTDEDGFLSRSMMIKANSKIVKE